MQPLCIENNNTFLVSCQSPQLAELQKLSVSYQQIREKIRLYPGLSLAALQREWDKELALWYELRALDIHGSALLPLEKILKVLVPAFYSKATFSRILRAGNGYLWELCDSKAGKKVRIRSLFHVCRFFKIKHISRPVEISLGVFKSRQQKRAWLYASFFRPKPEKKPTNNPISRKSIHEATGVPKRKQIRYENAIGIQKRENFAYQINSAGKIVPALDIVEGKSRLYGVHRQLGNSYQTIASLASGAFTKKVNRKLNGLFKTERPTFAKRFFLPGPGLGKRLSKRDRTREAFLWIGAQKWVVV